MLSINWQYLNGAYGSEIGQMKSKSKRGYTENRNIIVILTVLVSNNSVKLLKANQLTCQVVS